MRGDLGLDLISGGREPDTNPWPSAYLYACRGRTTGEVSRFLLSRGLWLILLEFTLVRLG
jgi:hypothetical protein